MRSVADDLRDDTRRRMSTLTPAERMKLAFELGDADVALLCSTKGIDVPEAKAIIARSRSVGRQPSVANRD